MGHKIDHWCPCHAPPSFTRLCRCQNPSTVIATNEGFLRHDLFQEDILEAPKPSHSKGGWGTINSKTLGILIDLGRGDWGFLNKLQVV